MILVDTDIKEYIENKKLLIIAGYNKNNINSISYDLTIENIIIDDSSFTKYDLVPGEVVFIKTKEKLKIPDNILGRIAEKNSKMRQGLQVSGPHYHPGHVTYAFLRVHNISNNIITISSGNNIAQIIFEELKSNPEISYRDQEGASFNDETEYRGLGNYKDEYQKQIKSFKSLQDNLDNKENQIYSNVLTFMGIIMSIFSLLSINFQALNKNTIDAKFIISINLSLCLCITVMMGLILIFINKSKNKHFIYIYFIFLTILFIILILTSIFI